MSHPVWVRGLKHIRRGFFCLCRVAPRVGAWIETDEEIEILNRMKSHPVWVRGLKLMVERQQFLRGLSHPVWVRGLKLSPPL